MPFKKILSCLLMAGGLAYAEAEEADRALLAREFRKDAPEVLAHPFSGLLRVVWPKDDKSAESEKVRLNYLRPADSGKGHSPIDSPYLAMTEDGRSYSGAFALRAELPDTRRLISFSSYKEIIDLLGPPTHLPIGGQTDDKWAYDRVSWRLFSPAAVGSIAVLEVRVDRKYRLGDVRDDGYLIESYSVRRGTLTKSEQAEAVPPVTR